MNAIDLANLKNRCAAARKAGVYYVDVPLCMMEELLKVADKRRLLVQEIETLRSYGNKDCTAMADEELSRIRNEHGK